MVKKYFSILAGVSLVASVSLFSVGCSQKTVAMDEGAEKAVAEKTGQAPVQPLGTDESLESAPMADSAMNILEGRTTGPMRPVYFDFDQSSIRKDQKERIENNSAYLKDNLQASIVIEGNCDERGTNEYNMALGDRRAMSAKKYLINLGVAANRISTISYGEERPLNYGHDELAWSQNRRDDFVQVK
jgi:peptidoglycan-associated lipoprotein